MLKLSDNQHHLTIATSYGRAWIACYRRLDEDLQPLGEISDWRLWVELPGKRPSLSKSPTKLAIESRLRAWTLRRCGRCLATLTFAELVCLAKGLPAPAPRRVYHNRESYERFREARRRHRARLKS